MSDLSEYEKKRLENIRQNQQVLRSLHIPTVPKIKEFQEKPKVRNVAPMREKPVLEPSRRSSRIIERETGVTIKEKEAPVSEVPKKRVPRPPRITSHVPFAPQIGATKDFMNTFRDLSPGIVKEMDADVSDIALKYRMKNEHCILKVARDRIYSMAIHPSFDTIMAAAGTKEGELAFWDATKVLLGDCDEKWEPKYFLFAPHNGSISNLKYSPTDNSKLLTTSYDGSCLTMDLVTGTFSPWFQISNRNHVVTGFDLSHDGRTAYHSDTQGFLRISDLTSESCVQQMQLHEAKIGGVSISCDQHTLATCSNDRSIAIRDLRNLKRKLYHFDYKNAVTAVNFHPNIADCFVSTCYDNHIRIHTDDKNVIEIPHNNQTGRWVTLFKAVFDPKSTGPNSSIVCIGNMEERGMDMYDLQGAHLGCATSGWLTAQPAVNAVHPGRNIIVSGNASGKIVVWSAEKD